MMRDEDVYTRPERYHVIQPGDLVLKRHRRLKSEPKHPKLAIDPYGQADSLLLSYQSTIHPPLHEQRQ